MIFYAIFHHLSSTTFLNEFFLGWLQTQFIAFHDTYDFTLIQL